MIEPFAGSAGYSLVWCEHDVELFDIYEPIVGAWDYLIHASEQEIRNLPIDFDHIDEIKVVQEARYLIGLNLASATARPVKRRSKWARWQAQRGINSQHWGDHKKGVIIRQQKYIRHWKVRLGSYDEIPNQDATWFIDPPYQAPPGRHYAHSDLDYNALTHWVRTRQGQFIACEMYPCTWGRFRPFTTVASRQHQRSGGSVQVKELVWTSEDVGARLWRRPRTLQRGGSR